MNIKEQIGELISESEQFVDAKIETIRLETVEKTINISTAVLSWLIIFSAGIICFILLITIGIIGLANLTGSYLYGCLIVFGFCAFLFLFLIAFNKKLLIRPIKNFLLGEYLKSHQNITHE